MPVTLCIMTLSLTTRSKMTFCIIITNIMPVSIITVSQMTFNKIFSMITIMENVRQIIAPIVAKRISENIFYLYVSFLSHVSIKIVSQKMVILSSLSQKLVNGFFPMVSFMTDAKILLSAMLPHSHTLFLCLSRCLTVSPSFRSSINITRVCILDY